MQKYSNNSIMSKFIKNLLYNTYIPTCNTVNQGDFIIEGFDYVYETNLIKCTKTGYIGGKYNQDIEEGVIYGKNRLFNRYLSLTTQIPYMNFHNSVDEIADDYLPFAVLDIPNRTLTVNYSLYKFTGNESYTLTSDGRSLILNNPGQQVKNNYVGLDDYKAYCNVLDKAESNPGYSFATITLFENNNNVYINDYLTLEGVASVEDFKQWSVENKMYYGYAVQTPQVFTNLTDEQIELCFSGEATIIVYNYPVFNMVFELEGTYPVEFVSPTTSDAHRTVKTAINGISYSLAPDGSITIDGTATADSYYTINTSFDSTTFEGYLYNGFDTTSSSEVYVRISNSDYSTILQQISENDTPIVNNGVELYFSIFVPNGQTVSNYVMYPMIRSQDEITSDYVKYHEPYDGIININESYTNIAKYYNIRPYEWGKVYNKYTQNFISNSNYYDINLHNYFGNYLRALRDVKGIDLMPYYNIYSGDYISNYRITENGFEEYYNNTYKLLKVPIRFNKTYTICIDCSSQVWMCPAMFAGNIPLVIRSASGNSDANAIMTDRLNSYGNYIKSFDSMTFTSPVTFSVENVQTTSNYGELDCAYFQQYERNLCLLIQLPVNNNSSIVILEGDYTDTKSKKVVDNTEIWQLHEVELNRVFCSNLTLMQFDTKENYVYSDRIVEYLLWNVINPHDTVEGNFTFVQSLAPLVPTNFTPGIWNNYTRSKLYNFATTQRNTKNLDLNGFVDKDTEKLLTNQMFM